ncbi:hypothetical protein OAB47_04815 [Vicingaceae bacterium]|nr:hypothetical protein [Vicingaceae bacterium]
MSKVLIADSGSTKTDWRLINTTTKQVEQLSSKGLNPFHNSKSQIIEEIVRTFGGLDCNEVSQVFFYGAGCSSKEKQLFVMESLQAVFRVAHIEVNHDLLAAARASLNKDQGIILILGTGSSCGVYDGDTLSISTPSLGYILSDEGSGVAIGKSILKNYFYNKFPSELSVSFNRRYLLNKETVLNAIYKEKLPNKYIASFSQFAFHNKHHPFISKLINDVFTELFESLIITIPDYKSLPISIVGSIGFYYSDFIRSVASSFDCKVGLILEKPIAGLTLYHTSLE